MVDARSVLLASAALTACGSDAVIEDGRRFVDDTAFRRAVLEASLVVPSNGYSRLRLESYAIEGAGWDALDVFDPPVTPVYASSEPPPVWSTSMDGFAWTHDALVETGRRAFESYPLSPAGPLANGGYGMWRDDRDRLGGLVDVDLGSGTLRYKTCATCHARAGDGEPLVYGASNVRLDLGRATYEEAVRAGATPEPTHLDWGPGHVDPTPDGMNNPTGFTDLRPVRHQNHVNVAATVKNDLYALAARVDTLMITSAGTDHRPPREVAFAIAYFLWSLGEPIDATEPIDARGAEVFEATCGGCHHADGTTAEPVPLEVVMTDPLAGRSSMRGTGRYRVPSLFRVGDRRRLLHRGQVDGLETLLDPGRDEPGHPFGWSLSSGDRAALIRFLRTL